MEHNTKSDIGLCYCVAHAAGLKGNAEAADAALAIMETLSRKDDSFLEPGEMDDLVPMLMREFKEKKRRVSTPALCYGVYIQLLREIVAGPMQAAKTMCDKIAWMMDADPSFRGEIEARMMELSAQMVQTGGTARRDTPP
jgi:hypothetical protein